MTKGKAAQCNLFWIENNKSFGGASIFQTKRWKDKVIDKNRDGDRISVLKYCFNHYVSDCGLDDRQKVHFCVSFVNVVRKFGDGSFCKVRMGGSQLALPLFKIFVSPPLFSVPPSFKVFQTVPPTLTPPRALIRPTNLPFLGLNKY